MEAQGRIWLGVLAKFQQFEYTKVENATFEITQFNKNLECVKIFILFSKVYYNNSYE